MACGKCNYVPRLIAWPHIIKSGHPADGLPWDGVSGTIDGDPVADFTIPPGECAASLRVQAVNLLPGDTLTWFYSADGVTWYAIGAGPTTWGIPDGQTYIDYFESSQGTIRLPLGEGFHYWRITVARSGCSDSTFTAKFSLDMVGTANGTRLAPAWKTSMVTPEAHDIRTLGPATNTVDAAFLAYALQTGYELCAGEDSLIPDLVDYDDAYLVLDCPEAGDLVEVDMNDYFGDSDLFANRLDTMVTGGLLGSLYHDQFGAKAYYTVVAESGVEDLALHFIDLYGRLNTVHLKLLLQCDIEPEEGCGSCTLVPNWTAVLAPYYYEETLYAAVPPPWDDSGGTIDGTAAASFVPADGKACAVVELQALNVLPGDVLQWRYSADGTTWYDFGAGPVNWGLDGTLPFLSLGDSSQAAVRLPVTNNKSYYFSLEVARTGPEGDCGFDEHKRKLVVTMTDNVLTSQARLITLKAQGETVSVVDGRLRTTTNTQPSGVATLDDYVECEGGCDPDGTDPTGGGGGTTQDDIDDLFEEVATCMSEVAQNNWVDETQFTC